MGRIFGARSRAAALARACVLMVTCVAVQAQSVRAEIGSWQALALPDNTVVIGGTTVQRWIAEPLVRAAEAAGVDPAYVMALADKESSLRPLARARTSSAEGLFQFVEDTWLHVIRRYATKHGLSGVIEAVKTVEGRPVPEGERRTWLLNLRRDPYISALMAAEMIKEHRQALTELTERDPSETDLYVAHFLGLSGAARFVKLLATKPQQNAPRAFPKAAKANQAIFYEATTRKRRARSLQAVWARLNNMIGQRVARYANLRQTAMPAVNAVCAADAWPSGAFGPVPYPPNLTLPTLIDQ